MRSMRQCKLIHKKNLKGKTALDYTYKSDFTVS